MTTPSNSPMSSFDALKLMLEGNDRFARGLRSVETFTSIHTLFELAKSGQRPFCMILACSDSRVPTEVIFDRKLGDLFVIRVAGNVVTPVNLASLEYAALFFGIPLCIVLGHSGCGAVNAAVACKKAGSTDGLTPSLKVLVDLLTPAVPDFVAEDSSGHPEKAGQILASSVLGNSRLGAKRMVEQSPLIAERVKEGKLLVVSAVYNMEIGSVTFDIPLKLQPMLQLQNNSINLEIPRIGIGASDS